MHLDNLNSQDQRMKSLEPEIEMKTIDGRTLRVARWRAHGTGRTERPLLFFNGIGANIELIAPFAARLSNRDVVTFDMPGIGGSPEPTLPYRPWMMARIADKLMDDLGYDKIDVMGVSWGGGLAQQFAFQYGKRVEKLILAATSAGMVMVPGKMSALSKMADPRRYIDPSFMEKNFRTLYGGSTDGSDGHMSRIKAPSTKGYLYQLMAMAGWTSVAFLPFVTAKTLVMMGDSDNIVPIANGRILTTLMPHAELAVIKGGGHLFLVSQADETIAMIDAFLADDTAQTTRKAA
jgi:poly(3-hydroxyalkanoate) depolymerase